MQAGVLMMLQEHESCSDAEMYEQEIELAIGSEALGFDAIWAVEHHFTSYSMCPDNVVLLANLAARTTRVGLATGAVILPWNDPLRVVEKLVLLDHLSGGRAIFGFGRGLGRREFEGFRCDMAESRDRFNEAAEIIVEGLEKGWVEASTSKFTQPRVEVRPRPRGSFIGRTYMVTMSPESFGIAAGLGVGSMMFSEMPWEKRAPQVAAYREEFALRHPGLVPLPVALCDMVVCHPDAATAEELAVRHIGGYFRSLLEHYEMLDDHFERAGTSYLRYVEQAKTLREVGADRAAEGYINCNLWGTPEQILEKLAQRRALLGDFDLISCFSFSSLPYDVARAGMELFARAVLPAWRDQTP